jgi:hypothetical protein
MLPTVAPGREATSEQKDVAMMHASRERWFWSGAAVLAVLALGIVWVEGQDAPADKPKASADAQKEADAKKGDEGAQPGLVKVSKNHDLWIDTKRKAVVLDGKICLREGQLEMFACPEGTKEHESIVAVNALPDEVHAALLAVGAKAGTPVRFDPKYSPATGDIVDIYLLWKDPEGNKHQARAQDWIKEAKTGKAMAHDWVFAGSGFWTDEETGKKHYQANGGDFICVSNFPTAMLDLPIESSQANASLLFSAMTEKIPAKGTKVRLVLIPRLKKNGADGEKAAPAK